MQAHAEPTSPRARSGGSPPLASGLGTALLLLAFLALSRGLLVASLADVFLYGEEEHKGACAKALLDGLQLPWHAMAWQAFEGGAYVVSHLDAVAFTLVGESMLALKLVAFALEAAILLVGWRFARWAFGERAALVFGMLVVLAPSSVQKQALLALISHYQALPFTLLVLHMGARAAFADDLRARTLGTLGFAAGFGIYCGYQVLLVVGFVGLLLLVRQRRALWGRASVPGWIGFALGLFPLVWMATHVGSAVFDVHGEGLFERAGTAGQLAQLTAFLRSIYLGRTALDLVVLVARPLAIVLAVVVALRAAPRSLPRRCALLVGGYLAFFLVAYVTSGFAAGEVYHHFVFHRLLPAWPLGALLIGAAAQQALGGGRALRIASAATVGLLLLAGLRDTVVAALQGSPGTMGSNLELVCRTKGYGYNGYLGKISPWIRGTPAERLALMRCFREPDPGFLHSQAAFALLADPALTQDQIREAILSQGPDDPTAYWLGLGPWIRQRLGGTLDERVRAVESEPEGELLVEAIGRFAGGFHATLESLQTQVDLGLEQGLPAAYFRGLGFQLYYTRGHRAVEPYWKRAGPVLAIDPRGCEDFLSRQDATIQPLLRAGYRRALEDATFP